MNSRAALLLTVAALAVATAAPSSLNAQAKGTWLTCAEPGLEWSVASSADPYVFGASALHGTPGAENGTDPVATALRDAIANHPQLLPPHSYLLLRQMADHALFGHVGGRGGVDKSVSLILRNGGWQTETAGTCTLSRVFFGKSAAAIGLLDRPDPRARVLNLGAFFGTCGGPAPVPKQIDRVLVVWSRRTLKITVLIRPSYPSAARPPTPIGVPSPPPVCGGIQTSTGLRLILPRPIGTRRILDGAYYPAALVHWTGRASPSKPARTVVVH